MNPDLDVVRKINGLAGKVRPFDLMMDLIARYGHWAFVIYGLILWFSPGKDREMRRRCCILSFLGVCIASLVSFGIGKLWFRKRPFTRDYRIWNFTGHKANASFPSNHTMNGAVVVLQLLSMGMKGSKLMALMGAILAFPVFCRSSLSQRSFGRCCGGGAGAPPAEPACLCAFYHFCHYDFIFYQR